MGYMKRIDTDILIELNSFTIHTLSKLDEMIENTIYKWVHTQPENAYDLYKYHMMVEQLYQISMELENIFIQFRCI